MTFQCEKGCRDPKAKDGKMWHATLNECPYEDYRPNLPPGRPGKMKARGHPGPGVATQAQPVAKPATAPAETRLATTAITFSDQKADVTKGAATPKPVVVDYIVDWPHTEALWNFGFRVMYFGHVKVDEWFFDWHKHLPKEQFQLSKNAKMAAEVDPRNMYSRAATWFCKNIVRAPNLQAAHAAIDSIIFFEAFGGIFVALIFHYEHVWRESPKLKKRREEKAKRAALLKARAIDVEAHVVKTEAVPA